jgi:hypothetical protein
VEGKEQEQVLEQEHLFSLPITKNYEEGGEWIVEGVVSTSEVDSEKFRMTKPALEDLVRDAKILSTVLHNHLKDEEIGVIREAKVIQIEKDPEVWGAWVKILISKTVPKIWQKIRENVLSKFSIKGMAEGRQVRDKLAGIITEATGYKGAEVSIVSVPSLQTARILAHYVSKMKEGGFPMETNDLDKITMDAAKAAIKDLLGPDAEHWDDVSKILDLVEKDEKPPVEFNEEAVEKAAGSLAKVLTGLEALKGKVSEDLVKVVDDLIIVVQDMIEEGYPKPAEKKEKTKEEKEAEEAAAVEKAKKGEEAEEAAKKKKKEEEEEEEEKQKVKKEMAGSLMSSVEEKIADLPDDQKALFAPILESLKALSAPVEKEKKVEAKGEGVEKEVVPSSDVIEGISKSLTEVEKSIKDAADRIQSDQVVQMAEQVVTLQGEVTKLTEIMKTQVPIRKGLAPGEGRRPAEAKPFTEDKEYQDLEPRQKLGFLFQKMGM